MSPVGNFDSELVLGSAPEGGILAKGPWQQLLSPDHVKSLYVWIFQLLDEDGQGAVATAEAEEFDKFDELTQDRWALKTEKEGTVEFRKGSALAYAIVRFEEPPDKQTVFQWNMNLLLVDPKTTQSGA